MSDRRNPKYKIINILVLYGSGLSVKSLIKTLLML